MERGGGMGAGGIGMGIGIGYDMIHGVWMGSCIT